MPDFDVALNLPGFTIADSSGFNPVIYDLDCHQAARCPHCGGHDLRKKDKARRQVWNITFFQWVKWRTVRDETANTYVIEITL